MSLASSRKFIHYTVYTSNPEDPFFVSFDGEIFDLKYKPTNTTPSSRLKPQSFREI